MLPPEEIKAAITQVVEDNFGAEHDQMAQAVARSFGFGSTSAQLREVVESTLADLLEPGELRLDGRLIGQAQEAPVDPAGP